MELKFRHWFAIALAFAASGCERATTGERIPVYDHPNVALVLLDLQQDFLDPAGRQPVAAAEAAEIITASNRLIASAPALGVELAYVQNQPGGESDPRVAIVNDHRFVKRRADAFSDPSFDAFLRRKGVDHLVLAGVFADACVYYTAEGALNRGYKVQVVSDAVAAATDSKRQHALEALRQRGVELITTDRVLAEWARRKKFLGSR